jgi:hypothetical protein
VSCTTSPAWRWYRRGSLGLGLSGGLLLLVVAPFARAGMVALLVIGGAWIAMAGVGLWFSLRVAYELRLDEEQVIFAFPRRELRVPPATCWPSSAADWTCRGCARCWYAPAHPASSR